MRKLSDLQLEEDNPFVGIDRVIPSNNVTSLIVKRSFDRQNETIFNYYSSSLSFLRARVKIYLSSLSLSLSL